MMALFLPLIGYTGEIDRLKKEGEAFGKEGVSQGLKYAKEINPDDLLPVEDRGKKFDPKIAREQVSKQEVPDSEALSFIRDKKVLENISKNVEEVLFSDSDKAIEKSNKGLLEFTEEREETLETCFEEDSPYRFSVDKELQVQVKSSSKKVEVIKVCDGHESKKSHFWKSLAEEDAEKQKARFKQDPMIRSYEVKIRNGGMLSDYEVISKWTHKDNAKDCNAFTEKRLTTSPKKEEEIDEWISLSQNPGIEELDSTLLNVECIEPEASKKINGKEVHRKCWKKRFHYLARHPHKKGCEFLKYKNCLQTKKTCIQPSEWGCSLWELTYRCPSKVIKKTTSLNQEDLYGQEGWDTSYAPNSSLPEVTTKLKVFEEMKNELEKYNISDATKVQIFSGKKGKCSKSTANDLLYDCCFSFHGLAKDIQLSKCSADELALSEMREKGLCHYIGSYDEKFLELWKSRKEHVFCCFPSKLSRVFQEKSREQLGISWGEAESPDCRGLTQEEIGRLNFSTMDLSEAFDPPSQYDFSEKIQRIEERLKARLAEEHQ